MSKIDVPNYQSVVVRVTLVATFSNTKVCNADTKAVVNRQINILIETQNSVLGARRWFYAKPTTAPQESILMSLLSNLDSYNSWVWLFLLSIWLV